MHGSLRCLLLIGPPILAAGEVASGQSVSFQRDVLPVLSDRCFPCHGPDEKARQADLRLDREESVLGGGLPVVVPHASAKSELYYRVSAEDVDERMPPIDSNLALTGEEVETLRRWIDEGAEWGEHWAFVAPEQPTLPEVEDGSWPRNDLDRFVLARLERESLRPSPQADRAALLRRVTLDLTGLPPTAGELDDYLADTSDDAYERVVERLLASPRYGERMAWEWLDAARYADTDGFQADPTRSMWPWRDWLIGALNDNLPFDQFTIEALAGDLLPQASDEQVVASGFHRNHMYNGEGGRIPEETRVENVFDRTETTATVWLGLTMTCARCHDHKFDPITQEEYYRLFAFFDQTSESGAGGQGKAPPVLRYRSREDRARMAEIEDEVAALGRRLIEPDDESDREQRTWEQDTLALLRAEAADPAPVEAGPWNLLGPLAPPEGDVNRSFAEVHGPEQGVDLKRTFEDGATAWREAPELIDEQTNELSGELGSTYLHRVLHAPSPRSVEVSLGSDDSIQVWVNGAQALSKDVRRGVAADQERAVLDLERGDNELLIKIVNTGGRAGMYYRVVEERLLGLPSPVIAALELAPQDRDETQAARLTGHYRTNVSPRWRDAVEEVDSLGAERLTIEGRGADVMIMDELPEDRRRATRVLERGAYDRAGEAVTEGTPSFLPPLPTMEDGARPDRLILARWLVSKDNPLTARVAVNRAWQTYFGRGLVETSEDFGQQGAVPSHPMLLDWLARTFVESGWDVKGLHRLLVTSATYRQSPHDEREAFEADPDNVLLARGSRYRLPSWMLRDQALSLGGLLVERVGGPPVKPYQPEGVWAEATFGTIRYQADAGDALYRRSLYIFWRRIVGPTVFFDVGTRQACVVKPTRTNTPLHALTTLNEPAFVEAARGLARRAQREGGDDPQARIAWAFRLATARAPSPQELETLAARWRSARDAFALEPDQAEALLAVGASQRDAALDPAEHAAYTVVCSILLNLDEVLTRS